MPNNVNDDKKIKRPSITPKMVRDYLVQHPDFLNKYPELLSVLVPPSKQGEDNITDFQQHMVKKLQGDLSELKNHQGHLINASRNNSTIQTQVHDAVLSLINADDVNHLIHIVAKDWADIVQVDAISICLEATTSSAILENENIRSLNKHSIDEYLGQDDVILLRGDVEVSEEIFGAATPLIKAEALIKIEASEYSPAGLLAFGSRDPDLFTPGQGTELLRFMASAFRKCLIQWMKLEN